MSKVTYLLTQLDILKKLLESADYRLSHSNKVDKEMGRALLLMAGTASESIKAAIKDIVEEEGKNAVSASEAK